MKLRIFVMIVAVSIAACGGGGSDGGAFSDSANASSEAKIELLPKKNGKNIADRKFIKQQVVAERVVRKIVDAYHFVDVGKSSQIGHEMHNSETPHLQLRQGMEYLKTRAREEDDQLWSKKYVVATYIYILNKLPNYNFQLPFKKERAFLPLEKIEKEEIEFAKRVIVFFQQKADKKCPEPIGLRYFEENDPEFNEDNGNQRGWYIIRNKSWRALDSQNSDTQAHINWLQQNEEAIDSIIYFKADELNELEKAVRNLTNKVLPE